MSHEEKNHQFHDGQFIDSSDSIVLEEITERSGLNKTISINQILSIHGAFVDDLDDQGC